MLLSELISNKCYVFKQMEEIPKFVCALDRAAKSVEDRLKRETLRLRKSSTIVTFDCTVITLYYTGTFSTKSS